MTRWSDEDIEAIEYALDAGIIATPRDSIIDADSIPEWTVVFDPLTFPATLESWASTRLGDIQLRFIIPRQWEATIEGINRASRRRLIVTIREVTDDDLGRVRDRGAVRGGAVPVDVPGRVV